MKTRLQPMAYPKGQLLRIRPGCYDGMEIELHERDVELKLNTAGPDAGWNQYATFDREECKQLAAILLRFAETGELRGGVDE